MEAQQGQDLYQILEISRESSEQEIKQAYRRLALRYHPDKQNQSNNNGEASEHCFKLISEAYQVLIDPERRKLYDKYGIESLQPDFREPSRRNGFEGRGFSSFRPADDLFRDFFQDPFFASDHFFSFSGFPRMPSLVDRFNNGGGFGQSMSVFQDPFFSNPMAAFGNGNNSSFVSSTTRTTSFSSPNNSNSGRVIPIEGSSDSESDSDDLAHGDNDIVSKSVSTVISNGIKTEIIKTISRDGTVTEVTKYADGTKSITINGRPLTDSQKHRIAHE